MDKARGRAFVIAALLGKEPNDPLYSVMAKNMLEDELREALDAETRAEGLKVLKAEAVSRGLIEEESEPEPPAVAGAQMVPVEQLQPNPNNPRKRFDQDELDKLTASVRQLGVLSPILVVADRGKYRIVAGERRYRAAMAAGLNEVPVLVRELTEAEEFEVMLTENLQRADLDPIEEAQAYTEAVARGWKQTELAERLGISQAQIANRIRLLKLPEKVQDDISREIISPGHGLALVKVAHVPKVVEEIADVFAKRNISVAKASEEALSYVAREGKPLYEEAMAWKRPTFNCQAICEKCEMRAMGRQSWETEEHPYCLKPECWEKHQEEAKKKALAEKLQEVAKEIGRDDISDIPILDKLPPDNYEVFRSYSSVKLESCPVDCENLQDAVKYGEIIKACLNPGCWHEKEKAIKREQNREKREIAQTFEAKKDSLLQMCSMHNQLPRKVLIYMATQAINEASTSGVTTWTREKVLKQLYKDRGWELPNFDDNIWPYPDKLKDLVSHLEKLLDRDLWDVILYGLLRGITEDDYVFQLTLGAQKEPYNCENCEREAENCEREAVENVSTA